jgi:hypothetical protein
LVLVAAAALMVGLAPWDVASSHAAAQADRELAMLMRFMAALKGLMALAALALIGWRLGYDTSPRLNLGYLMTAALLVSGSGFIWRIDTVIEGAIAFHAGLGMLIALGCVDAGAHAALGRSAADRRATPSRRGHH